MSMLFTASLISILQWVCMLEISNVLNFLLLCDLALLLLFWFYYLHATKMVLFLYACLQYRFVQEAHAVFYFVFIYICFVSVILFACIVWYTLIYVTDQMNYDHFCTFVTIRETSLHICTTTAVKYLP